MAIRNACSPRCFLSDGFFGKAFSRASLTVEAAVVLPVFLVCMALVLQYGNVYRCAVNLSGAMTQAGEEMAVASYLSEYEEDGGGGDILGIIAGSAYASARIYSLAGDLSPVRSDSLLLSSFMEKDDRIDLVMTYKVKSPVGMIRVPGSVFLQRVSVRGWVGRAGSSGGADEDGHGHDHDMVYVAENGVVYHKDRNCTHIKLSIQPVSLEDAKRMRNEYGGKYYPCEKCGKHAAGAVFITKDGNRYHSSLDCPGLKRTISCIHLDEAGNLRPCSKCGG